jgi:acyl dehydratase
VALNPAYVGRTYPSGQSYVVGREKVREFARAIRDDNPAYHDLAAAQALGRSDLIAPPTFAFVLAHLAMYDVITDPELGLDYSKVVHGEERFVYTRPILAGDELLVTTTIDDIKSRAGNDMVTTRSEIATVDGEHVVTAYSLIIARGTAEEGS